VVVAPFEVCSVRATVSGPDETGAGTTVETTVKPPLLVCSVAETVTPGTETVPPKAVVTVTLGAGMVGTETTVDTT
jgi:hypothetical protein